MVSLIGCVGDWQLWPTKGAIGGQRCWYRMIENKAVLMFVDSSTDINNRVADITPPGPSYEDPAVMVIQNEVGPGGLVTIHLLSAQKDALERAKTAWWQEVPWESADYAHCQEYEEAGIWHYQLYWPVRGLPVKMDLSGCSAAQLKDQSTPRGGMLVMWMITGKDERVSEAVEAAVWRYLVWFDEWPTVAWVGEKFHKYAGRTVKVRDQAVRIEAVNWMMEYGIGVGIPKMKDGDHE